MFDHADHAYSKCLFICPPPSTCNLPSCNIHRWKPPKWQFSPVSEFLFPMALFGKIDCKMNLLSAVEKRKWCTRVADNGSSGLWTLACRLVIVAGSIAAGLVLRSMFQWQLMSAETLISLCELHNSSGRRRNLLYSWLAFTVILRRLYCVEIFLSWWRWR